MLMMMMGRLSRRLQAAMRALEDVMRLLEEAQKKHREVEGAGGHLEKHTSR